MAEAQVSEKVKISKDKLWRAITDYAQYPQFVENCSAVEVKRGSATEAEVLYQVSLMKDVQYRLRHVESPEQGEIHWTLIDSDMLKKNTGHWKIVETTPGVCDVEYCIDIEFKIPVPGFILSRLVKSNLPSMVKSFVERARKIG